MKAADFTLDSGSRVAVVGGGPAGCNMCGGIVSESMVQLLATEGIILPPTVVQRGIDSYVLHMDVGTVRIEPPGQEKRIAAVHRGAGPRGLMERRWQSFDGYLLDLAAKKGANIVRERVEGISRTNGKPKVKTKSGESPEYDLLVGAVGVNSSALKFFEELGIGYKPPKTAKTYICEFLLGQETIELYLGSSMHVFLLNLPRLEFAAIIPKGDYVTVVMLGQGIDAQLVDSFLKSPEVMQCFPPGWTPPQGLLQVLARDQRRRGGAAVRRPGGVRRGQRGKPPVQGRHRGRV